MVCTLRVPNKTLLRSIDVPYLYILVGGFPCQSFSVAGKRKGFEDTRGTLFFEIARIAKEKQPKALLLENVKGLVNHDKGRTLDIMIRTLNEIGYVVDFNVLNSKYFGVPQNRERIFIVAVREDLHGHEDWDEETTKGHTVVPKGKRRLMKYGWLKSFNFDFPTQEKVTTRLRDILETSVDEKYYLDEEKTAKLVAQLNGNSGLGKDGELGNLVNGVNISPTIDASYDKGLGPSDVAKNRNRRPMYTEPKMLGHVDIKGNDSIKRTYSTEGISPTLTTMEGGHRQPKIAEKQEVRTVLSPEYSNKSQNGRIFKDNDEVMFTLTSQDRHGVAIKEATKKGYTIAKEGDSVNVQFPGSKTRRGRVGKQIANTLEASNINQGVVTPQYRIRKLTPLECWRLQGFPDDAHEKVKDAGISDSQRYKQAGNAVTVNVVEEVGKKIIPYITNH